MRFARFFAPHLDMKAPDGSTVATAEADVRSGMALRAADPAWQAYVQFESKDRSACGSAIPRLLRQGRNRVFRANLMEQDHVAADEAKP